MPVNAANAPRSSCSIPVVRARRDPCRRRARRREPAVAVGAAVPRHPAHHRHRPAAVSKSLAPALRQARVRLEHRDASAARRDPRREYGAGRLRACDARGIFELHRSSVRTLRGGRRDPDQGKSARHAPRQHCNSRLRHRDRQRGRHHRRRHDPDPAAACRQRRAPQQRPRVCVLYLSRRQYRRRAVRRSAIRRCSWGFCTASTSSGRRGISGSRPQS